MWFELILTHEIMFAVFAINQFKLVPPLGDHDDEETKAMAIAFNNPRYS